MRAWLHWLKRFCKTPSFRLASTYLGIIMLMSVGFSFVFFNTSSHELGRQLPPDSVFQGGPQGNYGGNPLLDQPRSVNNFLQQRVQEGRHDLLIRLLVLNVFALVGGSELSYILARRTLKPIEQAMDAQVQFVSDASHELRTPLTVIQTTNDVSLRDKSLTLKQAKELITSNIEEVIKLKALSDGLLNLAKQDTNKLISGPLNIQDVAADAMNRIIAPAQEKSIEMHDDLPVLQVLAHPEALTEILFILLENAIKYSPANSTIAITAHRRGQSVFIDVTDQGAGISASDLPHIFRRFFRADSVRATSGEQSGYGLGLSIANKLVEHQHGKLSVISELGVGSTFTIKLPAA